jgi:RNA polymerase sigma-70 factor, ECF subfamily
MTKSPRRRGFEVLELVDRAGGEHSGAASTGSRPEVCAPISSYAGPESFDEFYRREFPRLLLLARALAGDHAAEDVAQETMIVAYRQWARIAGLGSPVGYVRGICAHKAVSARRRLSAEQRALRRMAARQSVTITPLAPDNERFWAEVRRLPRRQAQAAALFYALDLPVSVVAETLGCAEGTVKAHLSRARTQLSTRLQISEEQS